MNKTKIITLFIITLISSILINGCLGENKQENNETNKKPVVSDNLLYDPGFENMTSLARGYWGIAGYTTNNISAIIYGDQLSGFKIENNTLKYDHEIKYNGSKSVYIQGKDVFDFVVVSNWNQKINDTDIIPYGKDLVLSSMVKTINADDVVLMIQCWDSATEINEENLIKSQTSKSYGAINGTIVWENKAIRLVDVPKETKAITVRLGLIGIGEVWFDDAGLYSVG